MEDDAALSEGIALAFSQRPYEFVRCAALADAWQALQTRAFSLILLDLGLPDGSGLELCRQLRDRRDPVPVLFLTARDSISDRVNGLDLGADDYLVKPFDFDELLARLRVMTRRRSGHRTSLLKIGDLQIDTGSHTVSRGGRPIELSAREYAILEYMALNKGNVLSREQIETHVWNFDYSGGSNVVDVYISYLRKKIDGGETVKLIRTVWGAGWMLKEDS